MLEVRGLYAGYYRDLPILRGVSLKASARQITAGVGANGVRNATRFRTIFGRIRREQGGIMLEGRCRVGGPRHRRIHLGVCYIDQDHGLFREMTVGENLAMWAWPYRRDRRRVRAKL